MNDLKTTCIGSLGRVEDFPPSGLRDVEIDGRTTVLLEHGNLVPAIDGICPNAGALLAEGALTDERMIFPRYKAAVWSAVVSCENDMARIFALMSRKTDWLVQKRHEECGSPAEKLRRL